MVRGGITDLPLSTKRRFYFSMVFQVMTPWVKTEAAFIASEMLVTYHITKYYHNLEDHIMTLHHCENLKSLVCFI